MHREGFEPPADPLEEGCSCSVELPVHQLTRHRFLLVSIARPPQSMHPAGLEPATVRLRAGGSAVELRVRRPRRSRPRHVGLRPMALFCSEQIQPICPAMHWEGLEPSTAGFVDRSSSYRAASAFSLWCSPSGLPCRLESLHHTLLQCAVEVSSLRPPAYRAGALPLSYKPNCFFPGGR